MIRLDREAIARWLHRSPRTIREHCAVIGYDHKGRALYDAEACAVQLGDIPTRRRERQAA